MTENATYPAGRYAVNDVADLRVTRFREVGEFEGCRWRVECPCGYKAGPYVEAATANQMLSLHDSHCLWPRS